MSPEQRIYTAIRKICADIVGETNLYDKLPGDNAPYPFIQIGDQFSQSVRENKDHLDKDTQVIIHIWHDNYAERGVVSGIIHQLEKAIERTFGPDGEIYNSSIIPHRITNTSATNRMLLHGIVDVEIRI